MLKMPRFKISTGCFLLGVLMGIFLAVVVKRRQHTPHPAPSSKRLFQVAHYEQWFSRRQVRRHQVSFDALRYSNKTHYPESQYLYDRVQVLCLILVKNHKNARSAHATWATHCNYVQLVNVTTERNKIPLKRGKDESSWVILCKILRQIPNTFKWILVVYDTTFVLLENLRLFLANLDHRDAYYFGHAVQFWSTVYNTGQAGYVLSKGTISALMSQLNTSDSCLKSFTYMNREDYYLGKLLASMNIQPGDTRDSKGLSTFHAYNLHYLLLPNRSGQKLSVYPQKCCSPNLIAFQAIEGDKMYTYYYLLYTVQLFKHGQLGNKPSVNPDADGEVWKTFLKMRDIPETVSAEQYYKIWENIVDDPTSFASHMRREEYFDYL